MVNTKANASNTLRRDAKRPRNEDNAVDADLLFTDGIYSIGGQLFADPHLIEFPSNVRETFDEDEMADLRASIAFLREMGAGVGGFGVLHPITVRRDENSAPGQVKLIGIAGERRTRALVELEDNRRQMQADGMTSYFFNAPFLAPIVIDTARSESAVDLIQLHENEHHRPLSPAESGRQYLKMQRRGMTPAQIAHEAGKREKYIRDRLIVANAPLDVQALTEARPDSMSLVLELVKIGDKTLRRPLIKDALSKDFQGNFEHGIDKLTREARSVKNEYQRELERRAKVAAKAKEKEVAKAQKAAPQAPAQAAQSAVLGTIGQNGISSRTVVLGASEAAESTDEIAMPQPVPPIYEAPPERPFAKERRRIIANTKAAQSKVNFASGDIQGVNDDISFIIAQTIGEAAFNEIESDELGRELAETKKRLAAMIRTAQATLKVIDDALFKADIKAA